MSTDSLTTIVTLPRPSEAVLIPAGHDASEQTVGTEAAARGAKPGRRSFVVEVPPFGSLVADTGCIAAGIQSGTQQACVQEKRVELANT